MRSGSSVLRRARGRTATYGHWAARTTAAYGGRTRFLPRDQSHDQGPVCLSDRSSECFRLSYAPSSVSQQLAQLEAEVGVRLLEPVGRRVRLTEQAEILVAHTEAVLERLERAEADMATSPADLTGTLRIASFQTAALALVPSMLDPLRDRHPHLRVHVTHREPEKALPALQARPPPATLAWPTRPPRLHRGTPGPRSAPRHPRVPGGASPGRHSALRRDVCFRRGARRPFRLTAGGVGHGRAPRRMTAVTHAPYAVSCKTLMGQQ
ncbi:LysR family transcriptional regulator [Streptomyces sp. NPDC053560]|uniref:LysR family transcriptional regulator n=1 Tax=Streptomyces sp. NPDC053560 TaxID=3365711 RepID=UPI0037D6CFC8